MNNGLLGLAVCGSTWRRTLTSVDLQAVGCEDETHTLTKTDGWGGRVVSVLAEASILLPKPVICCR